MTLEEALYAHLKGTAAVTAIVGAAGAARIFPVVIPQGVEGAKYPCVVYERATAQRVHSLNGPSGLASVRIVLTCWAKTYKKAKDLANAIRVAIDGYSSDTAGLLGGVGGVGVSPILVEDGPDGYDDGEQVYMCQVDAICWHAE